MASSSGASALSKQRDKESGRDVLHVSTQPISGQERRIEAESQTDESKILNDFDTVFYLMVSVVGFILPMLNSRFSMQELAKPLLLSFITAGSISICSYSWAKLQGSIYGRARSWGLFFYSFLFAFTYNMAGPIFSIFYPRFKGYALDNIRSIASMIYLLAGLAMAIGAPLAILMSKLEAVWLERLPRKKEEIQNGFRSFNITSDRFPIEMAPFGLSLVVFSVAFYPDFPEKDYSKVWLTIIALVLFGIAIRCVRRGFRIDYARRLRSIPRHYAIVLSGLVVSTIYLAMVTYFPSSQGDMYEARATLIAMAQILTTIFAISVSLMIVSVQFISQTYAARVVKLLFNDRIFLGYLAAYTVAIFLALGELTLNFLPLQRFLPYVLFAVIFCICYLLVLLFHIPTIIHPLSVISRLTKTISPDFCVQLAKRIRHRPFVSTSDDEPFLGIEQILIRCVVENDSHSFMRGIGYLESLLMQYIAKAEKELRTVPGTREIREAVADVLAYFLRIYRQLYWEAISHNREEHLMRLCRSLNRLMVHLHRVKAFRALEWTAELYDLAGLTAVEKKLLTFLDDYVRDLEDLVKVQMTILDEPIFPFNGFDQKWEELTEDERDLRTTRSIMSDFILRGRVNFVSDLAVKAAEQRLESVVSFCMSIFSEVIDKALSLQPIGKKRAFVSSFTDKLVETHKKCVDMRINSTTFTTNMLHYKVEAMKDPAEVSEFGRYITTRYTEMGKYSIGKGFYDDVWSWVVNGRALVKDYPQEAALVIDVLEYALRAFTSNLNDETKAYYYWGRTGLESLRQWDNHPHKELTSKIDGILKQYPELKA